MSNEHRDSCRHCVARGDIRHCISLDCHTHDSWYARQLAGAIPDDTLVRALRRLAHALNFYDRVEASSEEERQAVGRDHFDGVFREARALVRMNDILTSTTDSATLPSVAEEKHRGPNP